MSVEKEVIGKGKFVDLMVMKDEENGVQGYEYLHEKRSDGKIVAILPFSEEGDFLIRQEVTPCWGMEPKISSITGGVDPGNSLFETVVEEMKEEAGYEIKMSELIPLGTCRGTKSVDTVYYLYACDFSERKNLDLDVDPSGDGSELEGKAYCMWMDPDDVAANGSDPLLYVMMVRLAQTYL